MSLTSYRAAPPRVGMFFFMILYGGSAATDSPAS